VLAADGAFSPRQSVATGAACLLLGLPVARRLRDRRRAAA
jgi:hypothetical protein